MFSYHLAHLVLNQFHSPENKNILGRIIKTDEKVAILLCFNGRVGFRAQQGCT